MSHLLHNISHGKHTSLQQFLTVKSGLAAQSMRWCEPLEFMQKYAGESHYAFLHSSQVDAAGNQQSLFALNPLETIVITNWDELQEVIASQPQALWIGNLAYEMGQGGTTQLTRYGSYYVFNAKVKELTLFGEVANTGLKVDCSENLSIRNLSSNMTKFEYLAHIRATLEQIHAGEFYQANITRKFFGEYDAAPCASEIFQNLSALSPAGYGALLKYEDRAIISSSPESFLNISAEGRVMTHPIKGTARRSRDAAEDMAIRSALAGSQKNKAENLMIVDLMRNDLAIHAEAGSVQTEKLFEITEYPHLYHMVSTISAQRNQDASTLEVIRGCFPPGSMTGAPKKRVMEWCASVERLPRGVYSGALGWIAGDGSADLSVVIRTILLEGKRLEFQVGGGIVADSEPYAEWEETLTKAAAICEILGISQQEIAAL